ncbi:MAG: DUF6427 family protein [Saprospiraceae bacterium]|nr:DUF6427 family protein [Saprospiraceae bacterium]
MYPLKYTVQESDTLTTKFIFNFLESGIGQNIFAIVLIYFHVLYINRLVIKHRLSNPITLLPGMFYALLVSILPEYAMLSPYLIGNTFVLIALGQISITYKKPKSADILFDVGFFIAVAGLIVPVYIFLLLLGFIGIFVLRSMKIKELLQMCSGILLVLFAYSGILYLIDIEIIPELAKVSIIPRLLLVDLRGMMLYKVLIIVGIAIFAVLSYGKYTVKKSIQVQKKIDILFWFMMVQLLMLFMYTSLNANQSLMLFIPLSILLSFNFIRIKSNLVQELIHLGVLILLFTLNFGLL